MDKLQFNRKKEGQENRSTPAEIAGSVAGVSAGGALVGMALAHALIPLAIAVPPFAIIGGLIGAAIAAKSAFDESKK